MRVILAGGTPNTMHFKRMASGWENLCIAFDTPWYSLNDALEEDADVCLYVGTVAALRDLGAALGRYVTRRCPRWRRFVMLQEGGISTINAQSFHNLVEWVDFDAFFCYSLQDHYRVFGKPVYTIMNAYPLEQAGTFEVGSKQKNRIMLGTWHHADPIADIMGTFRVMQALPHNVTAVCHSPSKQMLISLIPKDLYDRIEIRGEEPWPQFLQTISECELVVTMDGRQTWGRLDLDAAMVRVPCIGPWTAAKAVLFPELMTPAFDVKHAAYLADTLMLGPWKFDPKGNSLFRIDVVKERMTNHLRKVCA